MFVCLFGRAIHQLPGDFCQTDLGPEHLVGVMSPFLPPPPTIMYYNCIMLESEELLVWLQKPTYHDKL
jgi:hypothetical protein